MASPSIQPPPARSRFAEVAAARDALARALPGIATALRDPGVGGLGGPLLMAKLAAALMATQPGGGRIVNMASTAAKRAWPNASACHATPWGRLGPAQPPIWPRHRARHAAGGEGMITLFHDSAAVLVRDGVPLAAAEEARFPRIKHAKRPLPFSAWELPFNAIAGCLEQAGITLAGFGTPLDALVIGRHVPVKPAAQVQP
jgi:hypothetical protein